MPGQLYSVGRVVPQPKGTRETVQGWRCFDVRSTLYDTSTKRNTPSTIRWYIPDNKRWQNTGVPNIGSIVQISGSLLGRHIRKADSEPFPTLAAVVSGLGFLSTRQLTETPAQATSKLSPKRSLWANAAASPSKHPRYDRQAPTLAPQQSQPLPPPPPPPPPPQPSDENVPSSSQFLLESSSITDFTSVVEETPPPITVSNRPSGPQRRKSQKVRDMENNPDNDDEFNN